MATGNPFIYDTNTLVAVVPNLKKSQNFLLNTFFPGIVDPDGVEEISIDVDVGLRRMAPFVSPLAEGAFVEQRRYQTNTFKPAYIKDKRAPDLRRPVRRMIGERIGGAGVTGGEREMANLQFEMEDQVDMINRRLEWMAAQELFTGTVLVQGNGFPATTVDFGRDANLSVTLVGAARWGQVGVSPAASIEDWQKRMLKSSGAVATDIVMTTTPFTLFLADDKVKGAVFYPTLGQSGNVLNPGAEIQSGAVFKGYWGQYRIWLYNDWFINPANNVETEMLTDGTVLMCGPGLMGLRAFGMIYDPVHSFATLPYAPKTWVREDPAQRLMMMQSAPLPIPARVNASLGATVI